MDQTLTVEVKCPHCGHSLMNPQVETDGLPSIELEAKVRNRHGHIYLSQVYGSYEKQFSGVADLEDSVAAFFCPHCHDPFPVTHVCDCRAPMIGLHLAVGGLVKLCTRNGCKSHSLEFEDADELFTVFESCAR